MFVLPLAIGGEAMGVIISPLVGLMEQQVSVFHAIWTSTECSIIIGVSA